MAVDPLSPDEARRQVLALEQQIYADPTRHDLIAEVMAPDYWEVNDRGAPDVRADILERLATSPIVIESYDVSDRRLEVLGDVVVSTGRSVLRGHKPRHGAEPLVIERATRFVHVWHRLDRNWQTVYAQHTATADS